MSTASLSSHFLNTHNSFRFSEDQKRLVGTANLCKVNFHLSVASEPFYVSETNKKPSKASTRKRKHEQEDEDEDGEDDSYVGEVTLEEQLEESVNEVKEAVFRR